MARLNNVKRIITEDFEPQYQTLISKLGYVLNQFMSDTVNIVNGNIDFDNLNQNLIEFDISIDSNGKPLKVTSVNVGKASPRGLTVIRAQNLTNSTSYPTSTPFISYTPIGNQSVTISHVTGLVPNVTYKLTVIVI
jgi:hypothetical protein